MMKNDLIEVSMVSDSQGIIHYHEKALHVALGYGCVNLGDAWIRRDALEKLKQVDSIKQGRQLDQLSNDAQQDGLY
jgi:hypothetical protein